jgi:hypothetical protein
MPPDIFRKLTAEQKESGNQPFLVSSFLHYKQIEMEHGVTCGALVMNSWT